MTATGPRQPKPSSRSYATVQISTAADGRSDTINLTGLTLCNIQMPTAWDSANLGFRGSVDGSTFQNVYDSNGNLLNYSVGASRVVTFDPALFAGLSYLQLVSESTDGTGTAVPQTAVRTIGLGLAEYVGAD